MYSTSLGACIKELERETERECQGHEKWSDIEASASIEYKQMRGAGVVCCWQIHGITPSPSHEAAAPIGRARILITLWCTFQLWSETLCCLTFCLQVSQSILLFIIHPCAHVKSIHIHRSVNFSSFHVHYQAAHVYICSDSSSPLLRASSRLNLSWHILHIPHALTFIYLHNERRWHCASVSDYSQMSLTGHVMRSFNLYQKRKCPRKCNHIRPLKHNWWLNIT